MKKSNITLNLRTYCLQNINKKFAVKKSHKKRLIYVSVILAYCMMNGAQASEYPSLVDAISDTTSIKTYTLSESEITTSILGTLKGNTLTIDGSENHYGIQDGTGNKNAVLKITSGQNLIIKNIGSYTATTSDSIIDGKDIITEVTVNDSWNSFGTNESGQGAIHSTSGNITVTDSVFSNIKGRWGGAIYNKGGLSVSNSVFANNLATLVNMTDDGGAITAGFRWAIGKDPKDYKKK